MKYLKQKLMAAAAMMLISVLMLSSASFAWFSISVAPDVKNIKTKVTANENFEIALGETAPAPGAEPALGDTGKNETWGGLVTFTDDALAGTGIGPATVLADAKTKLVSATYGADGRPNTTEAITFATIDGKPGISVGKDKAGNIVATRISLWLRSNKEGNVKAKIGTVTGPAASKARVGIQLGDSGEIQELSSDGTAVGKLTANTASQVFVYVYLDGPSVTAADVAAASEVVVETITFTSDGVTGNNSYDGSHGKTPPSTP